VARALAARGLLGLASAPGVAGGGVWRRWDGGAAAAQQQQQRQQVGWGADEAADILGKLISPPTEGGLPEHAQAVLQHARSLGVAEAVVLQARARLMQML
jgi:hypothetical protein